MQNRPRFRTVLYFCSMKAKNTTSGCYLSNRITVPIEIVKLEDNSYHLIIQGEIDGIKGEMIIDTGASVSVIDKALLTEKWEDKNGCTIQSGSVSGQIEHVELLVADYLKIGGRKLKNTSFAAIDLKYVNEMYKQRLKRKVIALLGSDFFVRYQAIIDYSTLKLTLKLNPQIKKQSPK